MSNMKQLVMSVYDSKAEMFNQPMFFKAKGEAIRAFIDEVNREGSALKMHPEDYTLFNIGEFDVEIGLLTPLNTPQSLGLATDYVEQTLNLPSKQRDANTE